jgi:hypothetical protein
MRKKSNALRHAANLASELCRTARRVGVLLLVAVFFAGAGAGVLYCNANPPDIAIHGTCDVKIPEFLIPSQT